MRKISRHLTRRRKRQVALLLVLMLVGAAAELLSLGAVVPFVAVLANPEAVAGHAVVAPAMEMMGITIAQLPLAVSGLFICVVLVAMVVRLTMLRANILFANGLGAEISELLYARTLQRPYVFHVSRNTSQIISSMNKVQRLIVGYVQPLLAATTACVLVVAIVALLVLVEPWIALGGAAVFGGTYGAIAYAVRQRLRRNGQTIAKASDERIQGLQEGLGGIRDVILDRAQPIYIARFSRIEQRFRKAQASSQIASAFPRIAVEALGILLLVGLGLFLALQGRDLVAMLPILGLIAVAAQRLIPLLQQIYSGWSTVLSSQRSVDDVLSLLDFEPLPAPQRTISFEESLRLEDVGFAYGSTKGRSILQGITLCIRRGERIGIVGPTGSGKSTLVDVIMGLLHPTHGRFLVDAHELTPETAPAWQAHIAHVPQAIYLSDATIAENIAFGIEFKRIDQVRLQAAAKAAQIHDHVASLPDGYLTRVGERGVRLSGGQRQRIGIARALYKGADLLVLDEATSALDDETEHRVMHGIAELRGDATVVMVAHRLTTMQACDRIIRLENGRITEVLDYQQLMAGRVSPANAIDG